MKKYLVNLDKLDFQFNQLDNDLNLELNNKHIESLTLTTDFEIDKKYGLNPSSLFHKEFYVSYKKNLFAIISICPKNTIQFSKDVIGIVSIKNHWLYTSSFVTVLKKFLHVTNMNIKKYHSLDIAIDGYDFIKKYRQKSESPIFIPIRTVGVNKNIHGTEVDGYKIGAYYKSYGSQKNKKSDKYITLYKKFQEIQKNNKSYIKEYWEANGLTNIEKMERCEGRMRSKVLSDFPTEVDLLKDSDFLCQYFQKKFKNYITFKSKNTEKEFCLIDFSILKNCIIKQNKVVVKTNKMVSSVGYKTALKYLFFSYLTTDDKAYVNTLDKLARELKLFDFVSLKKKRWRSEFKSK